MTHTRNFTCDDAHVCAPSFVRLSGARDSDDAHVMVRGTSLTSDDAHVYLDVREQVRSRVGAALSLRDQLQLRPATVTRTTRCAASGSRSVRRRHCQIASPSPRGRAWFRA